MASIANETQNEESTPSMKRSVRGIEIVETGSYAPQNVVHNRDLARLGCDEDWIIQRTGIIERRHAGAEEASSDLAYFAAKDCLDKSGIDPAEIDLILLATMTPDHYTPSTASLVQARLGCKAAAIDMNAACSGFMYAMITGSQFVKTGCYNTVLAIGADKMSAVIDPEDIKTYPLFGDAAGAAILRRANHDPDLEKGILAFRLGSVGEMGYLISVPGCGSRAPADNKVLDERNQFLKMNGKPVFKWAVKIIPEIVEVVLNDADMALEEIDLLILHQANKRIVDAALKDLDIPDSKVFVNLDKYGNTSAASIPLALDEAYQQGRIQRNSKVLLCGFGAGLTWGACVYQGY